MAWTTPEHVRAGWLLDPGDLPGDDALTTLIGRAERILKRLDRTLATRVAGDPELEDTARDVVAAMVLRVVTNPEGIRSYSETTGPLTTSVTHSGDDPGGIYVTDTEKDVLGIRRGRRRQQVFSAPTSRRGRPL
jgi:gene 19 protein